VTAFLKISVSIIPVFIFLSALVFLDSYKLVRIRGIVQTILAGGVVGVVCFFITTWVFQQSDWELGLYSRYISPVLEESLKACYILYLIRKKKIGFMVDGAIYGFAVGAGFAVVENIDYLISLQESNLFLWIIRGFGTAVMHGGTTSIFAILTKSVSQQQPSERVYHYLPGFLVAVAIHSFFNQFLFDPRLTTVVQLIVLPVLIAIIFMQSEKALRDWLELGLDTDVLILEHIIEGRISETKIGSYLDSLKTQFPGEVVADMLCYLRIYLELAIRAKGMLMMRGAGFAYPVDVETKERFAELRYLEKSIGKTGKLAISPLLHGSTRDLWQLLLIDEK
jgi:RsiW-degrading membrane proteinase PrsW (M82 family)